MSSESPVSAFLDYSERIGNTEKTGDTYQRALGLFESFVESRGRTLETATEADCTAWIDSLREEYSESTIRTYTSSVDRFYRWSVHEAMHERNPMNEPSLAAPEKIDSNPDRRDLTVADMREFLGGINHPLDRALVLTLLKTGVRVGELCNLDMADLNRDDGWSVRIAAEIEVGEQVRGEVREAANKRQHETTIPIDNELRRCLRKWLLVRPDPRSRAEPLFMSTRDDWGTRLSPAAARTIIQRHTSDQGWYQKGGGASENVTPHYFRHFFTTWMRERIGETGTVGYLRGDEVEDGSGPYLHNWQERAQDAYRENIYLLTEGER